MALSHSERACGRYLLCLAFAAMGAAAMWQTIGMNRSYGLSFGAGAGNNAMLIDAAGVVLAIGCGVVWRGRHYAMAVVMTVLLVLCMTYSTYGVLSFSARERLAKTRVAEAQHSANREAAQTATSETVKLRSNALSWLQGTWTRSKTGEKKELIGSITELAGKPVEIKPAPVDEQVAVGDPAAEHSAAWLGMTVEQFYLLVASWPAVVLLLIKFGGFGFSSALWPRKVAAPVPTIAATLTNIPTTPPDGGNGNRNIPGKFPVVSRQKALTDYIALTANGQREPPQKELAERWRCSPGEVSKRLKMFRAKVAAEAAALADSTVVPLRRAA